MSTFLQLVQAVSQESGTVPNTGDPATLAGHTGRMARIIGWVREAYEQIQIDERDWLWLVQDFEGSAVAGARTSDSGALGITERFSEWKTRDQDGNGTFTIQDPDLTRADEGLLSEVDYPYFRRQYTVGAAADETGAPVRFAIDPQGRVAFYPKPDKAYILRGQYRKAPQVLSADADVPEMPAQFHDAIKWRALVYLGVFDENGAQTPAWQAAYNRIFARMRTHQMPPITMAGPLA